MTATAQSQHGPRGQARHPPDVERYRWVAMAVVLIGAFMVILDVTIVNVALPRIGAELNRPRHVEWIVTAYLLAVGVVQPLAGWLSDRYGKRQVFIASLVTFTIGSGLCTVAPDLPVLVAFRVVQGLGGGAMVPVALAMVYELFPPDQRGRALGIWGIAVMAGPAIGPVLGGFIATFTTWRVLFVINVPIGVVGFFVSRRLLRDLGYREQRPFAWPGALLVSVGLVALLLALTEATGWGWSSARFVVVLAVGIALVAAFVGRSLRIDHPLVQARMFAVPVFSLAIVVTTLFTLAQYGRLVFIPLELETLHGLSALDVGLLLVPTALASAATMPIGGRLADRIGARVPVLAGLTLIGGSAWLLAHLSLSTPAWQVALYLGIGGLGNGFAIMPNAVVAMNSLPGRYVAQASAVRSLMRRIAAALGIAVLSSIVAGQIGSTQAVPHTAAEAGAAQSAYNDVFLVAFAAVLVAIVVSLWLPGRRRARQLQQDRARDSEAAAAGSDERELKFPVVRGRSEVDRRCDDRCRQQ